MDPTTTEVAASAEALLVDTGAKRDTRGRKIVTEAERAALIAAYQESGQTQRAFAQREGIQYSTFTAWLQGRRRAGETAGAVAPVKFTEVRLPRATTTPAVGVEVRLPDGLIVRGSQAAEVAALVRALRS
mgnify:CR=1 FL=1